MLAFVTNSLNVTQRTGLVLLTLLFYLISFLLPKSVEDGISVLLLLTLGFSHGGNDIELFKKSTKTKYASSQLVSVRLLYTASVLLGTIVVYHYSFLGLGLFIIFGSYHFGEQHFEIKKGPNTILLKAMYLSYGLGILFLLFVMNTTKTTGHIYDLTGHMFNGVQLAFLAFAAILLWMVLLGWAIFSKMVTYSLVHEMLLLTLLGFIFFNCSLLWGFTTYFIIWHSLPSLSFQIRLLKDKITPHTIWAYFGNALPNLIVVALLFFALQYYWKPTSEETARLIFSVIVGITLPHTVLMGKIFVSFKERRCKKQK